MENSGLIQDYWYRKMRDPIVMCLIHNALHFFYDLRYLLGTEID